MRFATLLPVVLQAGLAIAQPPAEPPNPLDTALAALAAGNTSQAISVLRDLLARDPKSVGASSLLAGIYLDSDNLPGAEDTIRKAIALAPTSAALHHVLGDLDFRKGQMKPADSEYSKASSLDPKDARAVYGLARIASLYSLNQTADNLYRLANRLNPRDGTIVGAFTEFAATNQEQADALEKYLASLDRMGRRRYQSLIARIALRKFLAGRKTWVLSSPYEPSRVPLRILTNGPNHPYGVGVKVSVNGGKPAILMVDTGATGLLINRAMAEKANVERIADLDVAGIGDKQDPTGYVGFAENVRVGDIELKNCVVEVSDRKSVAESSGLISPSVLERFLITLDFVRREMALDPLPGPAWDGVTPMNHYRGKELAGFAPVLRRGSHLLVPVRIEDGPDQLFLLDTGSSATMISKTAARDVTKVRRDSSMSVRGVSGKVDEVYSADELTLSFAGFRQKNRDVIAFDLASISRSEGTEVSGLMGLPLIVMFRLTIDYRDGVVKFGYTPP